MTNLRSLISLLSLALPLAILLPLSVSRVIRLTSAPTTTSTEKPPPREGRWSPEPGNYTEYPGVGYYKWYDLADSWGEAWLGCVQDGAHLVVVDSDEEADVVKDIIRKRDMSEQRGHPHVTYVGFHDLFLKGTYVTVLGDFVDDSGYTVWGPGQPDNMDGRLREACGAVFTDATLNDVACYIKAPFICEHEL
ncbi:unnamed protein product [Timema podura]|uniref:C-type lectin domain-containing protein n=1 Tax=Timema podura TaxID=61482 RepID=A0ABN7P277_TIMPD|nr:unnamed protein product [Timema podura]